jgi:ABC-type enterochelin transport system substrate-binding protein
LVRFLGLTNLPPTYGLALMAALAVIALAALPACSTIAKFDQAAFEKATAAKAEALVLMDKATEPYGSHRDEAEKVSLTIEKAYQYDLGRNQNAETIGLWEILKNPDGNLFGGFLRRWKQKGSLKPDAVAVKKPDIAEAFDQIIGLEIGKRRERAN